MVVTRSKNSKKVFNILLPIFDINTNVFSHKCLLFIVGCYNIEYKIQVIFCIRFKGKDNILYQKLIDTSSVILLYSIRYYTCVLSHKKGF